MAEHDQDVPNAGDLLVSTRVVYRIVDVREVESRVWSNRWRLDVHRVGLRTEVNVAALLHDGELALHTGCYRKGEKPAEWFARQRAEGRMVPP